MSVAIICVLQVIAIKGGWLMKRIIDGVTYNTDTATVVATAEWTDEAWGGNPEEEHKGTLYQTRGGAFFLHVHTEWEVLNRRTEEVEARSRDTFEPMTAAAAQKWVMAGEVELVNDAFGEPPEAVAEEAPGATVYVRVPTSLKDRMEEAASDDKLSVNAWAMRCWETCLATRAASARLHGEGGIQADAVVRKLR
jgi:hypothetical protein